MKKLTLMFMGCLLSAAAVYGQCGDGINTLKKWKPQGITAADLLWTNANSWDPVGVPDCDDDVTIADALGRCVLKTNVTVRDMQIFKNLSVTGQLRFEGSNRLTCRKLTLTNGVLSVNSPTYRDTVIVDTLIMVQNSDFTARYLKVNGYLFGRGGQTKILSNGSADLKHIAMSNSALFQAPAGTNYKARVDVRGDFILTGNATFEHNRGLLRFIDTGRNLINTAGSTGIIRQFWNVEINKKSESAGDITQPGRLYTPWGTNERWIVLNRLELKEACLESWNTNEYIAVRDTLIVAASMSNNEKNYGFGYNGLTGAQGGMYLLFDGDLNGKFISHGSMQGMYNIKINKSAASKTVTVFGSAQAIGSNTNYVDVTTGILSFDGTRNGRINANATPAGLVIRTNGRLIAPDDDSLFFNGCWNFLKTESFNAQNSTLVLDGSGDKLSFTNNKDTIYLRNVVVRTAGKGGSPSVPSTLNWANSTDRLYIRGNLRVADTCGAYFGNCQILLEGNLTSTQTQANTSNKFPDRFSFVGTNNQTINLSSAAKAAFGKTVIIDKPSGSVTLNSLVEVREIAFTSGLLNSTSSNILVISRPDYITGGNATSYINGPVRVLNGGSSSLWNTGDNTVGLVPVGAGGNYRPIGFSNAGNDQFEISYVASNAKSGDAISAPLDEVTTTDLWRIDHISGTSNYRLKLYLTGKPALWANTEVRIAAQTEGSAPWFNQGGTYSSANNMIWSTNVDITKSYMLFTHGRDLPAPMTLVKEGVSGREVATFKPGINPDGSNGEFQVNFNVYPNPVGNSLSFHIQNATKGVVTLSDMSGKVLGLFNAAEVSTIDMTRFAPGMYLVNFTDGITRITHRVVKN